MPVVICPKCKQTVQVGSGSTRTCPKCKAQFPAPAGGTTNADDAPTLNVPPVTYNDTSPYDPPTSNYGGGASDGGSYDTGSSGDSGGGGSDGGRGGGGD